MVARRSKVEQVWEFDRAGGKDGISAKLHGIEGVFASGICKTYNVVGLQSIQEGKLGVCAMKCGTEFDHLRNNFK